MRVKGVCFSSSRRAIVLEQFDGDQFVADLLEEPVGVAMPMVDKVRVDKRIGDLAAVLKQAPGVTVEGTNDNRLRVTYEGKSCYLPSKHIGNSMDNELKRQLRGIGVNMTGDQIPAHGVKAHAWQDIAQDNSVPDTVKTLGLQISDTTAELLAAALSSFKNDYQQDVVKKLDQGVNEAMEVLSEEPKLKERITALESEVGRLEGLLTDRKKERDQAVKDLVQQRDEARDRARTVESELANLKSSLNGLRNALGAK